MADEAARRVVETLFSHYVASALDPEGAEPDLMVERTGDGPYRITRRGVGGTGGAVQSATDTDLPVVLEHAVTHLLLDAAQEHIHLHAAGLGTESGAVLALGGSGTGKSSIAAAWSGAGHPVLGDDVALLGSDQLVHAFRKPLKIDARRARAAGLSVEDTPYWEADAEEVWFDPEAGGGWASASPPRALAFLTRTASGATAVAGIPPVDAARELLGQLLVTSGRPAGWHDVLFDLVERSPAYRVTFSDSLEAARALTTLAEPR